MVIRVSIDLLILDLSSMKICDLKTTIFSRIGLDKFRNAIMKLDARKLMELLHRPSMGTLATLLSVLLYCTSEPVFTAVYSFL